ncbi:MAG TPA: hypothetical protein DIS94_11520 [Bacteroidetes bacterium]|nr:hypothetical protein [Bacteroidota bacterium]HRF66828.1 hypothetical protein [Ignavibacteria bacterium]HRJ84845.1 hypothetical protein [Ignavibacteria bacterium]
MNIDITELFKNCSGEEMQSLTDYFHSPFFKIPKRLTKLHEFIIKNSKAGYNNTLTLENINDEFYPGEDSDKNYANIRKLLSEYKNKLNEFYSYYEFSFDLITKGKQSLNWHQRKNEKGEFQKQFSKMKETIQTYSEKDDTYYLEMQQLYSKRFNFIDSSINELHNDAGYKINDYLDKYYIANKLFLFQRFTSYEYTNRIDIEHMFTLSHCINEHIERNKDNIFKNDPEIAFRYLALELQNKGFNEDIYREYVNYINNIDPNIKINENGYYLTLLHTLSKIINEGHSEYEKEVIKLAELMEKREILKKYGVTFIDLKIIIESAIGLKSYDWALDFLNRTKNLIKENNSDNITNLLSAKLFFFKEEFNTARCLLTKVKTENYLMYFDVKFLELRIMLIQNELLAAIDIIELIKKYIKTHKDIGEHFIRAYITFADYVQKIIRINHETNNIDSKIYEFKKLLNNITSNSFNFYAKDWFVEYLGTKTKQDVKK